MADGEAYLGRGLCRVAKDMKEGGEGKGGGGKGPSGTCDQSFFAKSDIAFTFNVFELFAFLPLVHLLWTWVLSPHPPPKATVIV